jgi:hypothetical protein
MRYDAKKIKEMGFHVFLTVDEKTTMLMIGDEMIFKRPGYHELEYMFSEYYSSYEFFEVESIVIDEDMSWEIAYKRFKNITGDELHEH